MNEGKPGNGGMEANMEKVRVAMAGCGAITQRRHAPEYASNPYVEIAGF